MVSLGFLVLEGQWPRFVRELSRNEDFVGISAAFRSYDIDGNNRLSVAEDHRAISTQAAPPTYSYSYTMAPTMAPTTDTMSPTATEAPTRTETYAPSRVTEAPSYAPTTDTYAPTGAPTAP